jgi:hypothetical protein
VEEEEGVMPGTFASAEEQSGARDSSKECEIFRNRALILYTVMHHHCRL